MTLLLHDARRGGLQPFVPAGDRSTVGLYVCGVTPYDTGHLGHAFTYVSFDVLHRYLEYLGHDVVYVQNLTDVDDDMLRRARETGEDYLALGNRWVTTFLTEMAALNWLPPDHLPRATQHVPQMVSLIERLLAAGCAYAGEGHVYFDVSADPDFGEISHVPREEMLAIANERGNVPDMPGKWGSMNTIKVAVIGVGNCASSLVQGKYHYTGSNTASAANHCVLAPSAANTSEGRTMVLATGSVASAASARPFEAR